MHDIKYALRMMGKAPGFTAIAVLSLALGIGANTALFSLADAMLLKSLPVKEPERLALFNWQSGLSFRTTGIRGISVRNGYAQGMKGSSSFKGEIFEKLRAEQRRDGASPLSDLFAFAGLNDVILLTGGQSEIATAQAVSGGYFAGLGVQTMLGRTITDEDDAATAPPVAVLSHRYWQERFGGDPAAIGKQITLNRSSFTVIGVTPPGFDGASQIGQKPAITIPIAQQPLVEDRPMIDRPGSPALWWLHVMGRLKPGATLPQARESLDGVFLASALELMPAPRRPGEPAQLEAKDFPHLIARDGARGMWEIRSLYSKQFYWLFGVVGIVLLIACANVANLLLSRASSRAVELSVRQALGAPRIRLIRQLLTESLLLALFGGAVGVLFALWGKDALSAMGGRGSFLPAGVESQLDWRVLGFSLAVSILTGILFGLAPAFRATKLDLTSSLKESNRGGGGVSRSRLSKGLIIAQVAVSLTLLVGAGLFLRTLRNLQQAELGFNQENLLVFSLQPGASGYKDERLVQLYDGLLARLDAVPGARSATFALAPLVAHFVEDVSVILPGETAQTAPRHFSLLQIARENYFKTMEIPLLRGRTFSEQDNQQAPRVAVISEALARRYFPDKDPIGQLIGYSPDTAGKVEIIGVAGDIKYNRQREEQTPLLYLPWRQKTDMIGGMVFSLRAAGDPESLITGVRQAVREIDPALPISGLKTQTAQSYETIRQEQFNARLLGFFAALALTLAAIGLYGVISTSVTQRTHEIGVRMALGAQTRDVRRFVVWQGMKLALAGLAAGGVGAYALKRYIESELYGVRSVDPLVWGAVSALVLLTAFAACYFPARRATKVDPLVALRYE
jgi:predicted permease